MNATQRKALEALLARRSAPAGHVRRARIVLLSADGLSGRDIAQRVGISEQHVSRIRQRFVEGGVSGLAEQPKAGRKDHAVAPETIFFHDLKRFRAIATRFEKTSRNYLAIVHLACSMVWLPDLLGGL